MEGSLELRNKAFRQAVDCRVVAECRAQRQKECQPAAHARLIGIIWAHNQKISDYLGPRLILIAPARQIQGRRRGRKLKQKQKGRGTRQRHAEWNAEER